MSLSRPLRDSEITAPKRLTLFPYDCANSRSPEQKRRKVEVVAFLICNDVLVEVFSYFDRRQLAKLEWACRRFHRIVLRCFSEAPFLFFEMKCHIKEESRFFSKIFSSPYIEEEHWPFMVTGISLRKLDLNDELKYVFFMHSVDFGAIPSFVRIKSVYMHQFWPSIAQSLLPLLKQFSGNFFTSPKFYLNASITDNVKSFAELFASPMDFVSCLRKMLEIFERYSPQFTFCMHGRSFHRMGSLPLTASTLELPSVQASDNVCFLFPDNAYGTWNILHSNQNQVKVISDWLHRPYVRASTPSIECVRSLEIRSTERGHRLMIISRNSIEQLIEDLKVRFLCSHSPCQPYRLTLVLKEKFQSIANETLENRDTNEQINIQNLVIPARPRAFAQYTLEDSYTEITVSRTRLQLPTQRGFE